MSAATRSACALVVAAVLVTLAASCTKEIPSLQKPQDVEHRSGTLGQAVDDFGLSVTVLHVEPYDQSPSGFPRLRVAMRTESKRTAPGENPDVEIHCDEAHGGGDWDDASTWESQGIIVAGEVLEGQIVLELPAKDGTTAYPVASCTHARIVVTAADPADRDRQIVTSYAVAPDVVQAAIDAERGQ